jgi:hypothetical protein
MSLDTHSYDGQLGPLYHQILPEDPRCLLSFEQSLDLIRSWLPTGDTAHRALDLFRCDRKGNYDAANNIHVEELLPRVVHLIKDYDASCKKLFFQVLSEICALGPCPQGRTTRLLSFYLPAKYTHM